jgi:hypothetical protein
MRTVPPRPVDRSSERRALMFLARGPLMRWKGRWRFGIAWIGDDVVERLVAAGKARIVGDRAEAQLSNEAAAT